MRLLIDWRAIIPGAAITPDYLIFPPIAFLAKPAFWINSLLPRIKEPAKAHNPFERHIITESTY